MWIGTEKERFRLQRWLSIIVLCAGALTLIPALYQYAACQVPGDELFKPAFATALGGVMLYFSDKW